MSNNQLNYFLCVEIASVDSSGIVKAISPGEVTITAKSDNSKQDTLKLIVKFQAVSSGEAVVTTVTSKDGNANNSFNVSVVDVKVEEDFNVKSMENKSSLNETASTNESDSSGSGGAVVLLGAYGGIAYVLYRKNKKK